MRQRRDAFYCDKQRRDDLCLAGQKVVLFNHRQTVLHPAPPSNPQTDSRAQQAHNAGNEGVLATLSLKY